MKVKVLAVGKIKEPALRELIDDYIKRIRRYTKFEEISLRDAGPKELLEDVTKHVPAKAHLIALEVQGQAWSTPTLASMFESCQNQGVNELVFLIGGAYGLPKEISQRAARQFSMSALTLPHRLVRLLLVEQIYRAYSILANEPYSH